MNNHKDLILTGSTQHARRRSVGSEEVGAKGLFDGSKGY
jgi:hypothetical protein